MSEQTAELDPLPTLPARGRETATRLVRLLAVAVTWAGSLLAVFNLVAILPFLRASRDDFVLWYAVGQIVRSRGTARIYDFTLQQELASRLAGFPYSNPFVSPPPMAWLAVPFTFLPRHPAYVLWAGALAAALTVAWYLAAPGTGWGRWAWLALSFGLFPVAFGVLIGSVSALGALLLVVAWRLLRAGLPLGAGMVLSLLLIKPQLAFLVPLALLVAGHWRAFAGWALGSIVLLGASALALGHDGLQAMLHALQFASTWPLTERFTLAWLLSGPPLRVAQVAVAMAGLVAAWRARGSGIEIPIAAGIVASLLATPHLSIQDYALVLPAAWLVWQAGTPFWVRCVVAAGFVPVELALSWGPLPILVLQLIWLAALVYLPSSTRTGKPTEVRPQPATPAHPVRTY